MFDIVRSIMARLTYPRPARRRRARALFALMASFSVTLWVAPAGAQSGAAGLPDAASQKAVDTLRTLSAEAEKVRTTGVLDATRINDFFAAHGAAPFQLDLPRSPDRTTSNTLWSYFFRGSQVYPARLNAERPVVGYYNVLADAWLVTRWVRQDGTLKMSGARVLLGDVLQGATGTSVQATPRWLAEIPNRTVVRGLQDQAAGSVRGFHAAHPLQAAGQAVVEADVGEVFSRSILTQRLAGLLGVLADVTAEGPIAELEAQFAQAIKSGDGAALKRFAGAAVEPRAVSIMIEANRRVREGLSPLLAVETGGVTVVFSAAPTQARFLYFTEYHRQADGRPAVRGVGAFDAYAQVR